MNDPYALPVRTEFVSFESQVCLRLILAHADEQSQGGVRLKTNLRSPPWPRETPHAVLPSRSLHHPRGLRGRGTQRSGGVSGARLADRPGTEAVDTCRFTHRSHLSCRVQQLVRGLFHREILLTMARDCRMMTPVTIMLPACVGELDHPTQVEKQHFSRSAAPIGAPRPGLHPWNGRWTGGGEL